MCVCNTTAMNTPAGCQFGHADSRPTEQANLGGGRYSYRQRRPAAWALNRGRQLAARPLLASLML